MQSLANLPEYVTLACADAINSKTGYYTWNIPEPYYSKDRGTMCFVSMADGNVSYDTESNIVVRWENGNMNHICSRNDTGAFIKAFTFNSKNLATTHRITTAEPVKLLVSARPRQITLSIVNDACDFVNINTGVFILKFEYVPTEDGVQGFQDTLYKHM